MINNHGHNTLYILFFGLIMSFQAVYISAEKVITTQGDHAGQIATVSDFPQFERCSVDEDCQTAALTSDPRTSSDPSVQSWIYCNTVNKFNECSKDADGVAASDGDKQARKASPVTVTNPQQQTNLPAGIAYVAKTEKINAKEEAASAKKSSDKNTATVTVTDTGTESKTEKKETFTSPKREESHEHTKAVSNAAGTVYVTPDDAAITSPHITRD